MSHIKLIVHNVRSCHNVGSLLRTADGLGVDEVYLTGYTPYPTTEYDGRLPHITQKIDKQIQKTALGAERSVSWQHCEHIESLITALRKQGFEIVALEQHPQAKPLPTFRAHHQIALIVGREVEGIESDILALSDVILDIPMAGRKESLNVAVAAAIGLYHLRFAPEYHI